MLGVWLAHHITHTYSLSVFGSYSGQISELFIMGFILKLGFDMLVLKEKNTFRLFRHVFPVYVSLLLVTVPLCLAAWPWLGARAISILLFSTTLVLAELLRRRNLNAQYIFMSGGLQYTLQTIMFLSPELMGMLGVTWVVFLSVLAPFAVLILIYVRVLLVAIGSISKISFSTIKPVLSESVGQLFFNLTTILNNWLGTYLLSFGSNLDAVAIFAGVKRITNGLSFPQQVLNINLANPLARALEDPAKLKNALNRQRRLFFYVSAMMAIGSCVLYFVLPMVIKVQPEETNALSSVYVILSFMMLINVLTGPTFIFTRITGKLKEKVVVIIAITLLSYGLTFAIPQADRLIGMCVAAFCSMTFINIFLMYSAYRDQGVHLHARP